MTLGLHTLQSPKHEDTWGHPLPLLNEERPHISVLSRPTALSLSKVRVLSQMSTKIARIL